MTMQEFSGAKYRPFCINLTEGKYIVIRTSDNATVAHSITEDGVLNIAQAIEYARYLNSKDRQFRPVPPMFRESGSIAFAAFVLFVILVNLFVNSPANAGEWYGAARVGPSFWADRSNNDGIESGDKPGAFISGAIGHEFTYARVEGETSCGFDPLHGRNDGPDFEKSADGDFLYTCTAMVNVWPQYPITENTSLYVGGGFGGAWHRGLGDMALVPAGQVGVGTIFDLTEDFAIEAGARYIVSKKTSLNDSDSGRDLDMTYNNAVLFIGGIWRF